MSVYFQGNASAHGLSYREMARQSLARFSAPRNDSAKIV
jgi:hypothetical protein